MNFQQLRSVRETIRQGFNLTTVAEVLNTSQPGVSRQIKELESELGIELFVRVGKRLTGLTPPGQRVLPIVERLLQEADNLKRAAAAYCLQALLICGLWWLLVMLGLATLGLGFGLMAILPWVPFLYHLLSLLSDASATPAPGALASATLPAR